LVLLIPVPLGLRPKYVTGIQPAQVLGLKESFDPTDVGSLDSCDEHRDEVVEMAA
jgi:hypothetical protein